MDLKDIQPGQGLWWLPPTRLLPVVVKAVCDDGIIEIELHSGARPEELRES